jgi:hypothetical protein
MNKLGSVYSPPGWGRFIRQSILTLMALFGALVAFGMCAEAAAAESGAVSAGPVVATELPPPCPFSPGWNLVVLNGVPADLPECITYVARWEGAEERWYTWDRYAPSYWNDLTVLSIDKGYWAWGRVTPEPRTEFDGRNK